MAREQRDSCLWPAHFNLYRLLTTVGLRPSVFSKSTVLTNAHALIASGKPSHPTLFKYGTTASSEIAQVAASPG